MLLSGGRIFFILSPLFLIQLAKNEKYPLLPMYGGECGGDLAY
jgi:hypothetical protein